jgi:hypothetical protein
MTPNDDHADPIADYLLMTGQVLKRIDPCANRRRRGADQDCPYDARRDSSCCSEACAQEMHERIVNRFGVSTGVRLAHDYDEHDTSPKGVGATRNPRGLSSDWSGIT